MDIPVKSITGRSAALRIVSIYAIVGGLWIYLSDSAVRWLIRDPDVMIRIAVLKGLLFIVLTASLLYFLIKRTASRMAETNLRLKSSEERFQTIFDNMSDAVFIHDAVTGRMLDVNRTACTMFGHTCEAIRTMEVNELSLGEPPYSQAEALERLRRTARGVPQVFEWLSREKDGGLFWTEVRMRAATIRGEGQIIVSVRDISERKRAEQALRDSEENLKSVMELMPVGVSWADTTGVIEYMNPDFVERFGYTLADIPTVAEWFLRAYPEPAYREKQAAEWERDIDEARRKGGLVPSREAKIACKDGIVRHVIINIQLAPNRTIVIFTDITEQENLRNEFIKAQKLESLGMLAGGIAHDFNNILTAIVGNISFAQIFLDEAHKSARPLREAEKAAQRAAELAHQLLTFAKGGQPIKKAASARHLINESVSLVLRGSKVKGNVELQDDLLAIEVDEGQISQAFNNIIINAMQAMPGGGTITIRAENVVLDDTNRYCLTPGEYVRIIFSDQGDGIPFEDQKRIFDP